MFLIRPRHPSPLSWEARPIEPTDPKSKTLIDVGPTEYRTKESSKVPQTDEDTISSERHLMLL